MSCPPFHNIFTVSVLHAKQATVCFIVREPTMHWESLCMPSVRI